MNIDTILLVDKPRGWTSFDVVAKIRGAMHAAYTQETGEKRKIKVGHTGTLDPMATGLMIIVTGKNTKRVPELMKQDKTYEVEMTLGANSDTGDAEGTLTAVSTQKPSEQEVRQAVKNFLGTISQVPPMYSAIKVNGQRAYALARAGKKVELEPRTITIHDITHITYSYPVITFTTSVSSGTYIRSLVEDIGTTLGTGAYMSALRRTRVGEYQLAEARSIEDTIKILKNN